MSCNYEKNCSKKDCNSPFCLRKYKLDFLYNEASLSESQKHHFILKVDTDGTDLEEFRRLANIKDNISEFIDDHQNLYLYSSVCGNGKAQPDTAKIFSSAGYISMKDITVGHAIFGEDGTLHKVIEKFDRGERDIYRVEFQDGTSTECCNEHLWTVYDHKDKLNKTITTEEILNLGLTFEYSKIRAPQWRFDIPVTKAIDIKSKNNYLIDPYILGYLLGDGHISRKACLSITVCDDDAAETIPYINSLLPVGYVCEKKAGKYIYNLKLANNNGIKLIKGNFKNQLKTQLGVYGLLDTSSFTKFIPECYKHTTIKNRLKILQGLMDTDGTVSKQAKGGCQISYSTVSEQLAEDLAFLTESLGGTCSIRKRKGKSYTYNGEKRYGSSWYNCTLRLPANINPFHLSRKRLLYEKLKNSYQRAPYRNIKGITYIGKKHCYCIMTDNPTHLYLTDNLVVTHNTSWTIKIAQAYLNKVWAATELKCKVLFVSVPRFLLASKDKITKQNDYFDHIKANYLTADLVIWDDIGSKLGTEYEISQLLSMIDARLNLEKSNIFTSNLSPAEITEALGERLASRVCNKSVQIELRGSDKRNLQQGGARKW